MGTKAGRGLPPGPKGLPVGGVMPQMAKDPLDFLLSRSREYLHVFHFAEAIATGMDITNKC